jgi:tetratricopeptide (TPR) repeat protein
MLLPFTKYRKSKDRKQAEILVNKGLSFLHGSFQHKALYHFQQALEIDPQVVREFLNTEFDKSYKKGKFERALAVGLIVLKIESSNFELANKLGNCARKMKQYKQANDLYRQAFRINRKFEIAFYNLAASMGRIPKYNKDVKVLVDQFLNVKSYILPNYKIDPKYLEHLIEGLKQDDNPDSEEEKDDKAAEPNYSQICEKISKNIKSTASQASGSKRKEEVECHIFNLGLYALSKRDSKLALKCFFQLKNKDSRLEYLDMVISLAMDLESPSKKLVQHMMILLGKDKTNRYLNANLGLMFRKQGKRILSYKYLATASLLLEKTGRIYCRMDIVRMADQEMELGNLRKALRLYQLVDSEIEKPEIKTGIGQILLYQNRYSEALPIFLDILKIDKSNAQAVRKLTEIHNYFLEKGEELVNIKKFKTALPFFEQALTAFRKPETIKKTADVYKLLMDTAKAEELYIEYNKIAREQNLGKKEGIRKSLIEQGKERLVNKDLENAIKCFEKAFEMKVDKDVFVFLAHIYKMQKRTKDIQSLMTRWKEMIKTQGISLDEI